MLGLIIFQAPVTYDDAWININKKSARISKWRGKAYSRLHVTLRVMYSKERNNIVSRGELAGLQKTEESRQEPDPNMITGIL